MILNRAGPALCLFAVIALLAGCATPPPADDPESLAEYEQLNDPLEPTNRAIFAVNIAFADYALTPVAMGYRAVTPKFGRDRISDILANMKSPGIFGNDLLQGNFTRAGETLLRFLLNTSFGVGGIMDVATPMGIGGHTADLGETLAVWGVGEGPYLVLPLFGPSNPRDTAGLAAESYLDPLSYYFDDHGKRWASWARFLVSGVSAWENYHDSIEEVRRTSLDYYSAMRSLSRQRRASQVKDAIEGAWKSAPPRN